MSSGEDVLYSEYVERVVLVTASITLAENDQVLYYNDPATNIVISTGTDESGNPVVTYLDNNTTSIGEVVIEAPPLPIIIEPKLNLPSSSAVITSSADGRLTFKDITVAWYPSDNAFTYQVFFIYNNPNIVLASAFPEINERDMPSYSASTFFSEQSGVIRDKYATSYKLDLPGPILNREDPVYNRVNAFVFAYDLDGVRSDFPSFMMTFLINSPKTGTPINKIIIENSSYGDIQDGKGYSTNIVDETPNYGGVDQNIYTKDIV